MILSAMRPVRAYADTSVYGGVFDDEFALPSRTFFERVREGRFELVVSALVEEELARAPVEVRDWFGQFRPLADSVSVTTQALALRQAYLDASIVSSQYAEDALHVALATIATCGIIISWNFRHIVHYRKIPLYNAVNALHGWAALDIRSPLEVIENED